MTREMSSHAIIARYPRCRLRDTTITNFCNGCTIPDLDVALGGVGCSTGLPLSGYV